MTLANLDQPLKTSEINQIPLIKLVLTQIPCQEQQRQIKSNKLQLAKQKKKLINLM